MHLSPTTLLVLCLSLMSTSLKAADVPAATPPPAVESSGESDEAPLALGDESAEAKKESTSKNESVDMEEEPTELERQQNESLGVPEKPKAKVKPKTKIVEEEKPAVDPELAATPVPEEESEEELRPAVVEEEQKEEVPEKTEEVASEEERYSSDSLKRYVRPDVTLVEISPYAIGPFRERRPRWTTLMGFGISQYLPKDYKPNFVTTETFDSYYSAGGAPEFILSIKRNFSWVAFSIEIGASSFRATSKDESTLSVTPARLGFGIALDAIFNEPYMVPYFQGGAYTMLYRETIASQSVSGNTSIGGWYALGLRFQMDWIDEHSDRSGYLEYGMENTFLFVEGRSYLASQTTPNLASPTSQPIQLGGGIQVEF